jgi:hypothetical protein
MIPGDPRRTDVTADISKQKALEIARKDASGVYRNMGFFKPSVDFKDGHWVVNFTSVNSRHAGGGPKYVINKAGEIVSKRYEQ